MMLVIAEAPTVGCIGVLTRTAFWSMMNYGRCKLLGVLFERNHKSSPKEPSEVCRFKHLPWWIYYLCHSSA